MILHIDIDISQIFSPSLAVSVLVILALTGIRRAVWAGTTASPKSLVGAIPMLLRQGCADALCWVQPARCTPVQPGCSRASLHSLFPRNILITKVFWHILLINSSIVDMRNLHDYIDVQDTKILQYLHVFETSALKARALIAFFSETNAVSLLERSPWCKYEGFSSL